jgi:hypothetical protein
MKKREDSNLFQDKMLEQISLERRNKVLIEFTKALILNSKTPALKAIEQILIAKS